MPTTFTQAAFDADNADALSRRREAEAGVFRALAERDKVATAQAFRNQFEQASSEAADMGRRAMEMRPIGAQDPEGTPYPLSDRRGNFADNADQANQGGIGIFDSNSRLLEAGEGTPNARLNPEIVRGDAFAPSVDENKALDFMPKGDAPTQEAQEDYDRARLQANLNAGVQPVAVDGDGAPERRKPGRPRKVD